MRKTIAKWLVLTALFAYAIVVAAWAYARAAETRVSGIEIEVIGDTRNDSTIRAGIVGRLLRYDAGLVNKPLAGVDLKKLERYLRGFSNFETVECALTSDGHLRIQVVPMVPEIRVFDGNDSYYINKDGKHIAADAQFFTDVPVVTGRFSRAMPPQTVLPVTRFIARDSLLSHLVGMVEVIDADNIILIPRIRGSVINIGDTADLPYKRRSIAAAYREILPRRGWNMYDTVSVKFRGQIVCTRRDKSELLHSPVFEEDEDPEEAVLAGIEEI